MTGSMIGADVDALRTLARFNATPTDYPSSPTGWVPVCSRCTGQAQTRRTREA